MGSIRQRAAFARLFLCRRVKLATLVPLIPLLYTISHKDGVMRMQKIARVCAAVCAAVFLAACANEITIEPKQIPDTGSEWQNSEYTAQFKTDGTWSVTAKNDSAAVQSLSGEYRGETVRSGTVNMEISSLDGEQTDSLRTTAAVTENTLSFSASWNGKTFSETFTRAQSVTGVTLRYNGEEVTALTLPAGMFAELSAEVAPSGALVKTVSWSSSSSKIVSVDSSGKITAVSPGTATVTAVSDSVSGESASCTVTVTLDDLQLSHQEVSVNPGESFKLQCFPDISVSWTSSDPERVSVSESGLLTAAPWPSEKSPAFGEKDPEPVTITAAASVNGVNQSALCTVTIVNNHIQITPAETTLMAGDSESFSVSPVYGEDTGNLIKDIKWSVEPEGIVSLPSDTADQKKITVTATDKASGTARLTVSATVDNETVESSAVITVVNNPTVTGITIDPSSVTLTEQTKSKELSATVTGAGDLTAEQVIWSSSDTSVAKVSDGLVTAQGKGLAVIKAVSQSNPAVYAVCPVWVEAEPEAVTIWQLAGEQGALETGIIASFGLSDAVFYDNGTWSISSSNAQYAEGFASGTYPENTDTTKDTRFKAQVTDTALGIDGLTADISITGGAQNLGVQITVPGIGNFTFKFIRKQ